MTLGEYLNRIRNERGYSLRELSVKSGISAAELSRIETGKRKNPSPAALLSIAGILVVDYSYLLQLAGYMPENSQKEKDLSGALTDPEGNLRDLYECAEEMYITDKGWLQTAYLISKGLSEQDRDLVKEFVNIMWARLRKDGQTSTV